MAVLKLTARGGARVVLQHRLPRRTYKVLLMGSDDVTLPTLTKLHQSCVRVGEHAGLVHSVDVLCPGDRPAGRGHRSTALPVKAYAAAHGLRTVEVPYGVKDLRGGAWDVAGVFAGGAQYDVGVVVSFGYLLPPALLSPLRLGAINLHPSLLPRHRGAAPIPRAILAGDTLTGVSVIDVHPSAFDAGAVLAQEVVPIREGETCGALRGRLADAGATLVMSVLADYANKRAGAQPQAMTGATSARKLKPEEGVIQWGDASACTSARLHTLWRGLEDSVGVHTHLAGRDGSAGGGGPQRVKLLELSPCDGLDVGDAHDAAPPGSLLWQGKQLYVRTSDGWLRLHRLLPDTRKPVTGADLANGWKLKSGLAPARFVTLPPTGGGSAAQ